jgi:DNA polymerase-3 subunit alpha
MNEITEHIPDEAKIADELQEMKEAGEEPSIIKWALENNGEELKEWCSMNEDGTCDGPMARLFEQAMRLEGTYKSMGKHAAGVIISPVPLSDVCPMAYDKKNNTVHTAMEYEDLEWMGLAKFDILGVAALDKIQGTLNILKTGRVNG